VRTKSSVINPENPMIFLVRRPAHEEDEKVQRNEKEEKRDVMRHSLFLRNSLASIPWKNANYIESQI